MVISATLYHFLVMTSVVVVDYGLKEGLLNSFDYEAVPGAEGLGVVTSCVRDYFSTGFSGREAIK